MFTIRTALERAQQARACQDAIKEIAEFARHLPKGELSPVTDLHRHPSAPEWAYWYSHHVIRGRWPEAEPIIMASKNWAYWYMRLNA